MKRTMWNLAAALALAAAAAACTPNGIGGSSGSGGGGGVTHVVDVNLTLNQAVNTPYGKSGGMKPAVLDVAVGDSIQFANTDGFAHTSTSVPGTTQFPSAGPGISALTQSGATLSGGWTSGAMQAGGSSQLVKADKPGTYFYGCFFHYGAPMRGAIVAH